MPTGLLGRNRFFGERHLTIGMDAISCRANQSHSDEDQHFFILNIWLGTDQQSARRQRADYSMVFKFTQNDRLAIP